MADVQDLQWQEEEVDYYSHLMSIAGSLTALLGFHFFRKKIAIKKLTFVALVKYAI